MLAYGSFVDKHDYFFLFSLSLSSHIQADVFWVSYSLFRSLHSAQKTSCLRFLNTHTHTFCHLLSLARIAVRGRETYKNSFLHNFLEEKRKPFLGCSIDCCRGMSSSRNIRLSRHEWKHILKPSHRIILLFFVCGLSMIMF